MSDSDIALKAYNDLFGTASNKSMTVKYSRAFRPYNANVKYSSTMMVFSLSREWKRVHDDIKIGLIQSLLCRVHKYKAKTINMDLYDHFLKSLADFAPAECSDPVLKESFDRVNARYFEGNLEPANLKWGQQSFSKLGTYEYATNTITLSRILIEDEMMLDYVMYHEMLHKKHKFSSSSGRSRHHTKAFRQDEALFEIPDIEARLGRFLRSRKSKKKLFGWF